MAPLTSRANFCSAVHFLAVPQARRMKMQQPGKTALFAPESTTAYSSDMI
jgi:hypothetical protein